MSRRRTSVVATVVLGLGLGCGGIRAVESVSDAAATRFGVMEGRCGSRCGVLLLSAPSKLSMLFMLSVEQRVCSSVFIRRDWCRHRPAVI